MLGSSHPARCADFSLPGDEPEAEPKGGLEQLQPSADVAIAEASETKREVSTLALLPPEGLPDSLIYSEHKPDPSNDLPVVVSSSLDPFSSSQQEKSFTDIQDNEFSAEAQLGINTTVNSSPVSPTIVSVKVAEAQGNILLNWKSDS